MASWAYCRNRSASVMTVSCFRRHHIRGVLLTFQSLCSLGSAVCAKWLTRPNTLMKWREPPCHLEAQTATKQRGRQLSGLLELHHGGLRRA